VSGEQEILATARMTPPSVTPPPADTLEPLRRATVGEYEISGELGRGGMATVFLAHDVALDRKVAIKVMAPSLTSGAGMVERFKREARTAASLSHPHIIPIYAVRETQSLLFFVMKYVEGRSLDTVIREQGQLSIPMVQAIMAQVGGALGYAHRRGIVHRDIKPANIMLDEEGWAVVTDFGIAKVADARGLTMTGVTIGTPTYMSPEQCASKEVTGATDQYSMGIVLYEMLAGRVPFEADSLMGIMWKHFNEPPPSLYEARPDCPPGVAEVVERMLAKDPKARWPTMEDAVAALGQPSLAPDDPVRLQMRGLAKGGLGETLREHVHTPASPVPSGYVASPDAPTIPSGPLDVPTGMRAPPTPPPASRTGAPPARTGAPVSYAGATTGDDAATISVQDAYAETQVEPATRPTPATVRVAAEPGSAAHAPRPRRGLLVGGLAALAAISGAAVWLVLGLSHSRGGGTSSASDTTTAAPAPAPVYSVLLRPPSQSIAAGQEGDVIATLLDSVSNLLGNREIAWQSTDTTVVRLAGSQGVRVRLDGVKVGTATIIATSETKRAEATVTVTAGHATVASVVLSPRSVDLAPGDSVRLVAEAKDGGGATLGGRPIGFQGADAKVARITPAGFLVAVGDGQTSVSATSEGKTSAPVTVVVKTPPIAKVAFVNPPTSVEQGRQDQLALRVFDARNRPVRTYVVDWKSSDERFATVSDDGQITARAQGNVTVTATVAGISAKATIQVTPPPRVAPPPPAAVARIDVTPPSATLEIDKTVTLSAMVYDDNDRPLADRPIQWMSSNNQVATVANNGTVTARSAGTATITASSGEKRVPVEVTVKPAATVAQAPTPTPTQPVVTPPPESPAAAAMTLGMVSAGADHSCGVLSDGSAVCWGNNADGQVGAPTSVKTALEPTPVSSTSALKTVVSGAHHSCGLATDGRVFCWGMNGNGQLGNGDTKASTSPVPVTGGQRFREIAAGADHTCGIATDGTAWCWGKGSDGQLGNRSTRNQSAPAQVDRGLQYTALAAGGAHTCGVATDGNTYCWGNGFANQLGIGVPDNRQSPDRADVKGDTLTGIAAGKESTCGVSRSGAAYCWGAGFASRPEKVQATARFADVTVGDAFACGRTRSGEVWCWGKGSKGQLGNGATADSRTPVQVSGTFTTIAAGDAHVCGVTTGGGVRCWGENAKGQLGTGSTQPANAPAQVQSVRR
jgi:serine/threonine protein kinase